MFHRLNRTEYQNSVNALLGTALPLRARLPPDPLLYGFDNDADAPVSAPLVQRYLELAHEAVAPRSASPRAHARLVPCAPATDPGCVRRAVAAFLPRAFRRPVERGRD